MKGKSRVNENDEDYKMLSYTSLKSDLEAINLKNMIKDEGLEYVDEVRLP